MGWYSVRVALPRRQMVASSNQTFSMTRSMAASSGDTPRAYLLKEATADADKRVLLAELKGEALKAGLVDLDLLKLLDLDSSLHSCRLPLAPPQPATRQRVREAMVSVGLLN